MRHVSGNFLDGNAHPPSFDDGAHGRPGSLNDRFATEYLIVANDVQMFCCLRHVILLRLLIIVIGRWHRQPTSISRGMAGTQYSFYPRRAVLKSVSERSR